MKYHLACMLQLLSSGCTSCNEKTINQGVYNPLIDGYKSE